MSFLPLYFYFILLCFLVSITTFSKSFKGPFYLKLFPLFLFIVLLVEGLSSYMASKNKNNVPEYNLLAIFEFCFYLWLFSFIIISTRGKKIARLIVPVYLIAAVSNLLFIQKINTINTITYSLGGLVIISFCIYYFLELFRLPQSVKLTSNPSFWICVGLLFFYCCSFPLIGLINYWMHISKFLIRNFSLIVNILHIFLYSLFTIAFLCRIRTRKYI